MRNGLKRAFIANIIVSGQWDVFFKGRRVVDVLLECSDTTVEDLIYAGVSKEDAVRLMGEKNEHSIIGRATHYIAYRPKGVTPKKEKKPNVMARTVVIHKKDGRKICVYERAGKYVRNRAMEAR